MLQKLQIQNYAIIENLTIDFSKNLNIITGETGAGKSILMGALSLILGQRADTAVLQDKTKKAVVEGHFLIKKDPVMLQFFENADIDFDVEILLRREIAANGKSRSFINDTPVNLSQLKSIATLLVDLHQQFDTLDLGNENFQRNVLDALANNANALQQFKQHFTEYTRVKKELEKLQALQAEDNKALDYHQFLFDELSALNLKENELEDLDAELKMLSHAAQIKQDLQEVSFELKDSEQPILQQIKLLQQKLNNLQDLHKDIPALFERLHSSVIELEDIADELDAVNDRIQFDDERIQLLNDRIDAGYKLLKKHQVNSTVGLLDIQKDLELKLAAVQDRSSTLKALEVLQEKQLHATMQIAEKIAANRRAVIAEFTKNVNTLLRQVGMPNARMEVQITAVALSAAGIDEIQFLFDANKTNRFEPLHKVASGGELSRLMLSIKSLVAKKLALPTLIFDEIDTGISGEAAKQVGIIMQSLAAEHQLIVISHQPQIAARAHAHYFVFKQMENKKLVTSIKLLNNQERVNAIAQMLSGENPTIAALQNAKEMLQMQ